MSDKRKVIFDCDGVIADSEPLAIRSGAAVMREAGLDASEAEYSGFVGWTAWDTYAELERRHGVTLPSDIEDRIFAGLREIYQAELTPVSGVGELIGMLGEACCVASNSTGARLGITLAAVGFDKRFAGRAFSAELVARGKPAPDLYLFAAHEMGWSPSECIVVEDSPHGVAAGVAAGMPVIGFVGGGHCEAGRDQTLIGHGAERVFESMAQVRNYLDSVWQP